MEEKLLKKLYFEMLRIRLIQESIADHYHEQEMRCPVHLCIGQEAIAVGVCSTLALGDYAMSTHRSHGHYLAKGGNLTAMMAELYGKFDGCTKGKGGSMHLVDLSVGFLGAVPIVGGVIPIAVGVAFALQMQEKNNIVAVFIGDAATEAGVFYESINYAVLKKLPVLFICENNFYSVYTPLKERQPETKNNLEIMKGFGCHSMNGDGNNVIDVYEKCSQAVEYIRNKQGPVYLEFESYRWREHCGPNYDNDIGYRTESEFLHWRNRCPIENLRRKLNSKGFITDSEEGNFINIIRNEIVEAFHFAKTSPFPLAHELFTDLYKN